MLAAITNNTDWGFVLSLVGLIIAGVVLVQTRAQSLSAWAIAAAAAAGVLVWWP